jgi:hypothetical protein
MPILITFSESCIEPLVIGLIISFIISGIRGSTTFVLLYRNRQIPSALAFCPDDSKPLHPFCSTLDGAKGTFDLLRADLFASLQSGFAVKKRLMPPGIGFY